ncbi:MAG: alpha amylase C-terminal domain-containing protein [Candidatus Sumerlaeaceae bacterium]|nr:alpha amylase C-terminal domain-containing protein [Candidatus Sumerlaeaceae bacterium]
MDTLLRRYIIAFVILCASAAMAWAQSPIPGMGAVTTTGGVSFRVWAPHANSVHVRGSFNGYGLGNPLTSEGASGLWSALVPAAAAGDQYKFYVTNNTPTSPNGTTAWRRDPYGRLVQPISPTDANSVVYNGSSFNWGSSTSYTLPARREVVLYEMHIGTFNAPSGTPATFDQAILRLDQLVNLGVNVVEVMPISELTSTSNWGYDPTMPLSVELDYGGPDAFKRFVKACHDRSLGVIVDVVYNHGYTSNNDMWEFDQWYQQDGGGIWFFNDAATRDTPWGPRYDYTRPEVYNLIVAGTRMYLDDYRVDGFRFDATGVMRKSSGNAVPGAATMLTSLTQLIATQYPGKLCIAEDFEADQLASKSAGSGGLGFDSEWDGLGYSVAQCLNGNDASRNLTTLRTAMEKDYHGDGLKRVVFSESHDMAATQNPPTDVPPYRGGYLPRRLNQTDPETSLTTRKLSMIGSALAFTVPGIPMMFMGQELYATGIFSYPTPPALSWTTMQSAHSGLFTLHSELVRLRQNRSGNTRGLMGQTLQVFHQNNASKVMAWLRRDVGGAGDDVVVITNFSATDFSFGYLVGIPGSGTWRVRFSTDESRYDSAFSTTGTLPSIASEPIARDGYAQRINLPRLPPYTTLILSQDAVAASVAEWALY